MLPSSVGRSASALAARAARLLGSAMPSVRMVTVPQRLSAGRGRGACADRATKADRACQHCAARSAHSGQPAQSSVLIVAAPLSLAAQSALDGNKSIAQLVPPADARVDMTVVRNARRVSDLYGIATATGEPSNRSVDLQHATVHAQLHDERADRRRAAAEGRGHPFLPQSLAHRDDHGARKSAPHIRIVVSLHRR